MFSSTFVLAFVTFIVVAGAVGLIGTKLRTSGAGALGRLDLLTKGGGRKDSSADMLLKQALLEVDKKTILDVLTPSILNYTRYFEQADVHIKPSTLFAISVMCGFLGAVFSALIARTIYVAPVGGLLLFMVPWTWLWWRR